jgi:hypothetical protein
MGRLAQEVVYKYGWIKAYEFGKSLSHRAD